MKSKILILNGHPDALSFCAALSAAYAEGARTTNAEVRTLAVGELAFEINLKHGFRQRTELEPDLLRAQEWIRWADHIVIVYPTWWGTLPAVLKGFFDRTLLPGFAFRYKDNGMLPEKLLGGKSARVIVTSDTPSWVNRLFYKQAGIRVIKQHILQFCGITPVRITYFSPVTKSAESPRASWLAQVRKLGEKLA
ncbi:putative NADPH-quinone reductase [Paenibacillus phyllosphaerae]|uniref:Putative NADPH-quinone reductase n=1 Tax=Paenibacillus phyllosphaerae TaxID=274593 RepID=A0A7W5AUB7_9BACL|nr:NAD(P)H-dependent oxidoreductase [Paenibacillus phyllosphaerae]MBB3108767.1 putative NADPH-quinone reductase [Paenibacillus phyllosphaerae]